MTDPESYWLTSATVAINGGPPDAGAELLAATTAGTYITASYNSTAGILTLNGGDTLADYQKVLQSVTYADTLATTTNLGNRTLAFTVGDGILTSASATDTVDIVAGAGAGLTAGPMARPATAAPANVMPSAAQVKTVSTQVMAPGADRRACYPTLALMTRRSNRKRGTDPLTIPIGSTAWPAGLPTTDRRRRCPTAQPADRRCGDGWAERLANHDRYASERLAGLPFPLRRPDVGNLVSDGFPTTCHLRWQSRSLPAG